MMFRSLTTLLTGLLLVIAGPTTLAQGIPREGSDAVPSEVEAMYTRGLAYLQKAQKADGSYEGTYGNEPGVVGFALMAFLAHGDDPNSGPYADTIKSALNYILSQQKANGYIGSSMYSHGFATLSLAESYGMIDDPRVGLALKKAVDLILTAQKNNPSGAWRYSPDANDADTTVAGCQLVALYAARNAGIPVPQKALDRGHAYMKSCQASSGAYGYTSGSSGRMTLTAIGTLTLALGKDRESRAFKSGVRYLRNKIDYVEDNYFHYYLYYMAQATFHSSEEMWNQWNSRNIRVLKASQSPDGHWASGGKSHAYSTSCSLLSLALNYRFLPIYEK